MRNFNTGSAQYNNFGEFGDYLKNLWGGQGQAQPWINPDSGIPEGGFAGATNVEAVLASDPRMPITSRSRTTSRSLSKEG
jgi:hypothetical protein